MVKTESESNIVGGARSAMTVSKKLVVWKEYRVSLEGVRVVG